MTPPMQIGIGIDIPRGGSGVTEVAPENSIAPVASGNVWVASTLSTTDGTWEPTPDSYTYQWQRDEVGISGATNATYTLAAADATKAIRCVVTATKGSKSASANSNAITVDAYDEDASAYLAAVVAAEAAVSLAQRRAVTTFVAGEKTASRWASIKRFYLPIWGAAEPNAIDMVTRASGTFAGTVAHEAGYVQGNGSNGYFAPDLKYQDAGMSAGSASVFCCSYEASGLTGNRYFGLAGSSGERCAIGGNGASQLLFFHPSTSDNTKVIPEANARIGVIIGSSTATDAGYIYKLVKAGGTLVASAVSDTTAVPNLTPFFLARNNNGSADLFCGEKFACYGYGTKLTTAQAAAFAVAISLLWETCTGLSLP